MICTNVEVKSCVEVKTEKENHSIFSNTFQTHITGKQAGLFVRSCNQKTWKGSKPKSLHARRRPSEPRPSALSPSLPSHSFLTTLVSTSTGTDVQGKAWYGDSQVLDHIISD